MLYFAYGSNMRAEQMAWRCPMARPLGIASLEDYAFLINKQGAASIKPQKQSHVQGILWRCTKNCITILDRHEGVAKGHYRRKIIRVCHDGKYHNSLVYIAQNQRHSYAPARGYLSDFVIKGGREFGLDEAYLENLSDWQGSHILKKGRKRPLVKLSQYYQNYYKIPPV